MNPFVLFLLLFLALIVAGVLLRMGAVTPQPERMLADTFKTTSKRLNRHQLAVLEAGQFIELGTNAATDQRAILSEETRFLNLINLGPTGAGKTTYFLATFLWRDIACPHNSVVIFDGQADLTEPVLALCRQYRREDDVLIFPDCGFNPLGGQGSAAERAEAFADLLSQVPEIADAGAAPYYSQQQQLFVRKVVPLYEAAYQQPMILRELLALALNAEYREQVVADAGVCPESSDYVLHFGAWRDTDFERNLSSLVSFIDRITLGRRAALFNQRFAPTLDEAIDARKILLIREGGYRHSQGHTLGLLFMIALQEYVRRRDLATSPHPVLVYLDEAHMYFNRNFGTFIATSRKKRVAQHLGFQTFAQFEPYTEVITTNARTWIVHGGLLHEDARVIADNIGQRRFRVRGTSRSQSLTPSLERQSTQHDERIEYDYLVQPHEIRGLAERYVLVLTTEGRETKAHQLITKPPALALAVTPYEAPSAAPYPPPTIWEGASSQGQDPAEGLSRGGPTSPPDGAPPDPVLPGDPPDSPESHEPKVPIPFDPRRRRGHQRRWNESPLPDPTRSPAPPPLPPSPDGE